MIDQEFASCNQFVNLAELFDYFSWSFIRVSNIFPLLVWN
jgi:hypothetical protein